MCSNLTADLNCPAAGRVPTAVKQEAAGRIHALVGLLRHEMHQAQLMGLEVELTELSPRDLGRRRLDVVVKESIGYGPAGA